tara:strand:+ start:807 stop:1214 length:408 start_codon:yes stop_codon:yes gene_type:complete
MKQIYSKIKKDKIIASIIKLKDIGDYRTDISPESEYIQVSARSIKKGINVPAHMHLPIDRETDITQETWIIISGKIEFELFDLDNSFICKGMIEAGGSVTLYRGGHSLKIIEENTIMYEIKTGPYFGIESDKKLL